MPRPLSTWLLAVVLLAAAPRRGAAQLATPTVTITGKDGSFNYKWDLTKGIEGAATGTSPVRIAKGTAATINYKITYTRAIDEASKKFWVSGNINAQNGGAPVNVASATAKVVAEGGTSAETTFTPNCPLGPLAAGAMLTCTFSQQPYTGFPVAGRVTVVITYTDAAGAQATASGQSDTFVFDNVVGKQATAVLKDKFDLTPFDSLYTGFTGFQRTNVWRYVDQSTAVPESGLTVSDSGEKSYAIRAGAFIVCTGPEGTRITNTATLAPADSGPVLTKTATAQLTITGCESPPTVNFQELQTWGAQSFSWALTSRAVGTQIRVNQDAGNVPINYQLTAVATPTTGTFAVSGSVFIANTQSGILNIQRLSVQLSNGQQPAFPQCALTTPYVATDGLVWGGTNAGGSITTGLNGFGVGTGIVGVGPMGVGTIGTVGSFSQFILPEFASATCRFNFTLTAPPSGILTIQPMLQWGFGLLYTLNQPVQETVKFNPPQNYFPVQGCISLTDVVVPGELTIANGGPNNQEVCVDGTVTPPRQPAALAYSMAATITPTTTPGCTPGGQKTFTVQNNVMGVIQGASPVSAKADPVQITVNCVTGTGGTGGGTVVPSTGGGVAPVIPAASGGEVANLLVSVGGYQTYVGGQAKWSVEKSADADAVSVVVGELPKTVTYTLKVNKLPAAKSDFFVAGKITVTNPGTRPVAVSSVFVTAGSAKVPTTCPPGAGAVPAGGAPLVCTFNVTWNNGPAAGALGARVDTPEATFWGQPASFDFTNPIRSEGGTADIYDDFDAQAPAAAVGVPKMWWTVDGSSPPPKSEGIPLTTVDSREYVYSVQIGPFADKGSCGAYRLLNTATVIPQGGQAITDTKAIAVSVTGCNDRDFKSVDATGMTVTVDGLKVTNVTANTWKVLSTSTPAKVTLAVSKSQPATFEVEFRKVPKLTHEVTGSVTINNADPSKAVDLDSVTVAVETATTAKTVDAVCAGGAAVKVAGGATLTCTFTATLDGAGAGGDIIATVTDVAGGVTESSATPFDFSKATAKGGANAPTCAQAWTGLVVGLPEWRAGGKAESATVEKRVCDTTKIPYKTTVGPFKDNQCGTFTVTHTALLRPLGAGEAPIVQVASLPVTVTGCSKSAPAAPVITAAEPEVELQELYTWTARLQSNASKTLTFRQKQPAKVSFTADTQRSPVRRSANVQGSVTIEAPSRLVLDSAAVAVYDGRATYTSVPLDCGAAAGKKGGPVTLRGRGAPVTCTYQATGLAGGPGAVLPVIIQKGASAPAPASPASYDAITAPRNIVGDCADLGSTLTLTGSDGKRAKWQPAFVGQAMGSGSDCEGGNTMRFALWFGANGQGEPTAPPCGEYKFAGSITVAPTNGDVVDADVDFGVKVLCKRRSLLEVLMGR